MPTLNYQIIDVFAEKALQGNALCVVLDECEPNLMQAIAREVNLSETTFPVITGSNSYKMRIFTTVTEFPFAGHPSLGTAWALGPNVWKQTTSGAVVTVKADSNSAEMTQPTPTFIEVDTVGVANALGIRGVESATISSAGGMSYLIVPTVDSLQSVTLNEEPAQKLLENHNAIGIAVCQKQGDSTIDVRVFFPGDSVLEDPGTGSLAGPLGVLAHTKWGANKDLTIRQGDFVGRPCRINVHADPYDLRVGGNITKCAEGKFTL